MFWNDLYGWQRNLWDDLANLETRFQTNARNHRSYPGIKIYAGENEATIRAEVPGVEAADLELQVQDDEMNIKIKRQEIEGEALRRERPRGEFEKTVRLPFRANQDSVSAELKAGVLTVRLERAAEDRPRKITVAAS
ncbi:MAG: hypothetical protein CMF59_09350 [Leptospiraceae bacterium]|nr:hypothetical protein [Leptospiraceae bacterium]|tara:strand:- start:128 stop:538 length:411 start_codon:yes stop_codon:yes gene_type:complete